MVEMDEGLRNGVVLAKLVRVFHGEAAVRRIYEVRVSSVFITQPLLIAPVGAETGLSTLG